MVDLGHILKESFNTVHVDTPYDLLWGNTAYYVGGVLIALIWVTFLHNRIPGPWYVKGLVYGVIISLVSAIFLSPVVSLAAGEWIGFFYMETWNPGLILLAGLIMHVGYGLVLLLCLKYAGVQGVEPPDERRKSK